MPRTSPIAVAQSIASNAKTAWKKVVHSPTETPRASTDCAARITRHCPTTNTPNIDARAEPLWREAADDAGLAAARRLRGEIDLAQTFERRSAAAEALAAELESEAFGLRLEAARLEAEQARRQDLLMALQGLAA